MSSSRDSGLSWSCWNELDLESKKSWEFGSSRYREKVGPPSMRLHIQVLFQRETSRIIHWIDMDWLTVKQKQNTSGGTSSPLVSHLWKQHLSTKSWLGVQGLNNFGPKQHKGKSSTRVWNEHIYSSQQLSQNTISTNISSSIFTTSGHYLDTTFQTKRIKKTNLYLYIYISYIYIYKYKYTYTPDSSHHFRLSTPIFVAFQKTE